MSAQLEDGYTRIANELLEALCRIRIPGESMQIFLVILRKTYGFGKKEDRISLSQFQETGISKPHIIRAIKNLVDMQLIIAEKGNKMITSFGINKHYSQWKPLPKKATLPKKAIIVAKKGNLALPKKEPTKETITKEKRNARAPSGDQQLFIAWWQMAYEKTTDACYMVSAKDAKHIKEMLQLTSIKEILSKAAMFFISEDDFYKDKKDISFFRSQINKIPKANGEHFPKLRDIGIIPPDGVKLEDWRFWEADNG